MTTLREHLEAIRERHYVYDRGVRWACGGCQQDHPCDDYAAAVAALAILNDSAPQCLSNPPHCSHRLIPDPPAAS